MSPTDRQKYKDINAVRKFRSKALVQEPLYNKVAGWRPAKLLKRGSTIGVFLSILRHF